MQSWFEHPLRVTGRLIWLGAEFILAACSRGRIARPRAGRARADSAKKIRTAVRPPSAANLPPPVHADARGWALFLDVDGSIVEYADTPDAVSIARESVALLDDLERRLTGALAILSGRRISDIDRMTAPLILPAGGLHGVERRRADGTLLRRMPDADAQACMRARCGELARRHPRAVVEDKGSCIALHFRAAPELGTRCAKAPSGSSRAAAATTRCSRASACSSSSRSAATRAAR